MNSRRPDKPADPPAAPPEPVEELTLEDTYAQQRRGLPVKSSNPEPVSGYNPYDVPPDRVVAKTVKPADKEARKPTDLRKLSEWIRLQRRVAALKDKGEDSGSK